MDSSCTIIIKVKVVRDDGSLLSVGIIIIYIYYLYVYNFLILYCSSKCMYNGYNR